MGLTATPPGEQSGRESKESSKTASGGGRAGRRLFFHLGEQQRGLLQKGEGWGVQVSAGGVT